MSFHRLEIAIPQVRMKARTGQVLDAQLDTELDTELAQHPAVVTNLATRTVYATDNSIYQVPPAAVALPTTAEEVAEIVCRNAQSSSPLPLVARGGGTGTNGQSLTPGLVVEVKRHLNRVLDIDVQAQTARVEPGLVTAKLNETLKPHGLFWAPHTSTLNRATVGGMISTDAAGKGSLVHGRAHRHVISLDVVLADGTPWLAEAIPVSEAEQRAAGAGTGAALWRKLLDLPVNDASMFALPELARGFSGYGIDRFRRNGLIDPVALLTGAEGTLAVITAATIRLTPIADKTMLFVASYPSFVDALDDAVELRATRPTAIESFDETTLERGRSSPAWPAFGAVVGEHRGSVLLLEYEGSELPDEQDILDALAATGRSTAVKQLREPAQRAQAWKVRSDAVGLLAKVALGGPEHSARPTAFVEDCVVPVESMRQFIEGFRSILDKAGVTYAMFGHADVGCVHVRPALDLTDPEHVNLVRKITDDTVELVARHGGVLWGEHGRGFRGESAEQFLSPDVLELMGRVKACFDPHDLLNPGKLYRPAGSAEALIQLDEVPLRGEADRDVPVELRRTWSNAFACNGNGLCHHYGGAEVMCPSYKATGDPELAPKGRADLLRAWLRDRENGSADVAEREESLAENLGACLSCAACSGHCPVQVNIPELKSQFLEAYWSKRKRPLSHAVLSRFEQLAMLAAKMPASLVAPFAGLSAAPLGLIDLPAPKSAQRPPSGGRAARFDPARPSARVPDLVIIPDVFSSGLDPDVENDAVEVLRHLGWSVAVAPFTSSGKFDHVKGNRAAFAKAVAGQEQLVGAIVSAGAVPVGLEPATTLLYAAEFAHQLPSPNWARVRHVVEVIEERVDQLTPASSSRSITLMHHCTEQATSPATTAAWGRLLRAVGHDVDEPGVGCCGMAGIFGHERENQQMSRDLWDLTWAAPLAAADTACAPGYSCRSQADRFGGGAVSHPLAELRAGLGT